MMPSKKVLLVLITVILCIVMIWILAIVVRTEMVGLAVMAGVAMRCKCGAIEGDGRAGCIETYPPQHDFRAVVEVKPVMAPHEIRSVIDVARETDPLVASPPTLISTIRERIAEEQDKEHAAKKAIHVMETEPMPSILAAPLPNGEQPTLGRIAYDAYGKARNWIAFNNQPIPQWEERPNLHEAWETVAKAISAESLETIARLTRERDSAIKQWKRAEQGIEEAHAALPAYLGAGALPVRIKELVDDENKAQADLEMLKAEVERMEPLFDASVAWCKTVGGSDEEATALHSVMKAFNETPAKDAQ